MDSAEKMREEMRGFIDIMPERHLYALRPLFDALMDTNDDMLSDEEGEALARCRKDRKERPETFTPWREVRKR